MSVPNVAHVPASEQAITDALERQGDLAERARFVAEGLQQIDGTDVKRLAALAGLNAAAVLELVDELAFVEEAYESRLAELGAR